jgi:hypothetical protein
LERHRVSAQGLPLLIGREGLFGLKVLSREEQAGFLFATETTGNDFLACLGFRMACVTDLFRPNIGWRLAACCVLERLMDGRFTIAL